MQDKFSLSSADVAKRLAFLRSHQGVTLEQMGEGKPSTAKSWEEGKMPRRDKWKGISQRLGLSDTLIFLGRPEAPEDYAFIAKWRNEIQDADVLLAPHHGGAPAVSEASQEPFTGTTADRLRGEARRLFDYIIAATRDDPARLGWVVEQLRIHLRKPATWEEPETHEQIVKRLNLPTMGLKKKLQAMEMGLAQPEKIVPPGKSDVA